MPSPIKRIEQQRNAAALQLPPTVKTLAATARAHHLRWAPRTIGQMSSTEIERLRRQQWANFVNSQKREVKERARQLAAKLARRRSFIQPVTALERGFTPAQHAAHKHAMYIKYFRRPSPRSFGSRGPPLHQSVLTSADLKRVRRKRLQMRESQAALRASQGPQPRPDPDPENDWGDVVGAARLHRLVPPTAAASPLTAAPEFATHHQTEQFSHLLTEADLNTPIPIYVLLRAFFDTYKLGEASSKSRQQSGKPLYRASSIITIYEAAKLRNPHLFTRPPGHSPGPSEWHGLSGRNFSLIIALFGALSVLLSASEFAKLPAAFRPGAGLLAQMKSSAFGTDRWKIVALVTQDKVAAGHSLDSVDRYWLMRMELAAAERVMKQGQRQPRIVTEALERAIDHYKVIKDADPLVHADFIRVLGSSGFTTAVDEAAMAVLRVINGSGGLSPELQRSSWTIVQAGGDSMSPFLRHRLAEGFASAVRNISTHRSPRPEDQRRKPPLIHVSTSGEVFTDLALPTLVDTCQALYDVVLAPYLPHVEHDPARKELYEWAKDEALQTLDGPDAWQFLAMLALASPGASERQHTQPAGQPVHQRNGERWHVLLSLSVLRSALDDCDTGSRLIAQRLLHTLWSRWQRMIKMTKPVKHADRAILIAFIQLAGLSQYHTLISDLLVLLVEPAICDLLHSHHDFIRSGPFSDSGHSGAALELGAALVSLRHAGATTNNSMVDWEQVKACLRSACLVRNDNHRTFGNYANQLLRYLLRLRKPEVAAFLYHGLSQCGAANLADQTRVELIQGFSTEHDSLDLSFDIFGESVETIPKGKLSAMLVALTRGIYVSRIMRIDRSRAITLCLGLQRTAYSTKLQWGTREHAHWRWTMLTCARSGQHNQVVALVMPHVRSYSKDAKPHARCRFLMALAGVLLKNRQFKAAAELLHRIPKTMPDVRRRVANLVLSQLARAGSHVLGQMVDAAALAKASPSSLGSRPADQADAEVRRLVCRAARFHERHPDTSSTYAVRRLLLRADLRRPELVFRTALRLLVQAGRTRAAIRFFDAARTDERLGSADRTALGNILLTARMRTHLTHVSPPTRRRRNLRQLRAVFDLFDRIRTADASSGEWRPDRVTLNVLLKAVIHWSLPVDATQLRLLFNAILRLGYPGKPISMNASASPASDPDIKETFKLGRLARVMTRDEPLDYVRHVHPLYRLFITAFRARGDRVAIEHLVSQLAILRNELDQVERGCLIQATIGRRRVRNRNKGAEL
ncbi:hypothetical protein BKA62DRAFT_451343 [Auriculariales sp. MPI-PUGE-AT-0066]|nr:hypothetical protein BKA62DRAFT_451343 [Auriculariales sp. MPI-PUGE-AT-0066]